MIFSLFRKDPAREAAEALFAACAEQARRPAFFERLGVADTVEGRFEMLALHVYLALARLKSEPAAERTAQLLTQACFRHLDDSLRELGVGDLSVGRKVRKLGEALYGRIRAYEAAGADDSALAAAVARNVFESGDAADGAVIAAYMRRAAADLAAQPATRILNGLIAFADPFGADRP